MNAVKSGERPPITESELASAPEGFVLLMRECWNTDAAARPTFTEVEAKLKRVLQGEENKE